MYIIHKKNTIEIEYLQQDSEIKKKVALVNFLLIFSFKFYTQITKFQLRLYLIKIIILRLGVNSSVPDPSDCFTVGDCATLQLPALSLTFIMLPVSSKAYHTNMLLLY